MNTNQKNYFKITLVFVLCLFARLIPFRMPNIEPVLAAIMPLGRAFGASISFFFGVLSVLFYDLVTNTLGAQTFFTAFAFGMLGLWSSYYFSTKSGTTSKEKNGIWSYVRFAIIGTLFYDAVTGLTVGPIFFGQSFFQTLVGQIPFTLLHLTGNIIFAMTLSPAIYKFLIRKKETKTLSNIINLPYPKTI